MRIELDERIIKILTCALNAKSRYTSVTVTFRDGEQKVDTLYTSPSYGAGTHFCSLETVSHWMKFFR